MKHAWKFAILAAALAAPASAQQEPPVNPAPADAGLNAQNPAVRNGGDNFDSEMMRARDEAIAQQRNKQRRKSRTVAAAYEDIVPGSSIRDPKGLLIGTVESVGLDAAVVASPGGKVEVPVEAFGKDREGLLVSMNKAEFDAAVAAAVASTPKP
jgi:hypothetical protein